MMRKEGIAGLNAELDINLETKDIKFLYKETLTKRFGWATHIYVQILWMIWLIASWLIVTYIYQDVIKEQIIILTTIVTIIWIIILLSGIYIIMWTSIILHENIKWLRDVYPIANGHIHKIFGRWMQINLRKKAGLLKTRKGKLTDQTYYIHENKLITKFPIMRFEYKYKSKKNKITHIRTYNLDKETSRYIVEITFKKPIKGGILWVHY